MKSLKSLVHLSFPKVRIRNKSIQTEESKLMIRRSKLKILIKNTEDNDTRESLEDEVKVIEDKLAKTVSKRQI